MKKLFVTLVWPVAFSGARAQKTEQYGEMTAQPKMFSRNVTTDIDNGANAN